MTLRTKAASQWKSTALAKRLAIYGEIPEQWRLRPSVIRRCRKQRRLAGDVIEKLLDTKSRRITALRTQDLLTQISSGALTCTEVAQAFCKRSAYAHQLVGRGRNVFFACSR